MYFLVIFLFNRWKIHEACMLALGSVKTIITENVKNGRIQFDMHGFLASVILADLNLAGESLNNHLRLRKSSTHVNPRKLAKKITSRN